MMKYSKYFKKLKIIQKQWPKISNLWNKYFPLMDFIKTVKTIPLLWIAFQKLENYLKTIIPLSPRRASRFWEIGTPH